MAEIIKEWNGTVMKYTSNTKRAELSINNKTVDFVESDNKFRLPLAPLPSYLTFLEKKPNTICDFLKGYDDDKNLMGPVYKSPI